MYMNDIDSDNINPDNPNNTIDLDIALMKGRIGLGVIKETQNSETQASEPSNKRKKMQPRSQVWQHFTRSESSDGVKAVCNYYEASFHCDSRKNAQAGSEKSGSSSSSNSMTRWWSVEGAEDEEMNSELDTYLSEKVDKGGDSYTILDWWRLNSPRYPILGRMARDVLAIPVSTVASEYAFSTGGRVLDAFRSSLSPKIVQDLLCGQNWMRNSTKCDIELTEEESEQMESDLTSNENDKLALDGVVDAL
ncbi:hypothetical protein Dimus_008188 [Dionaea muscipula]